MVLQSELCLLLSVAQGPVLPLLPGCVIESDCAWHNGGNALPAPHAQHRSCKEIPRTATTSLPDASLRIKATRRIGFSLPKKCTSPHPPVCRPRLAGGRSLLCIPSIGRRGGQASSRSGGCVVSRPE